MRVIIILMVVGITLSGEMNGDRKDIWEQDIRKQYELYSKYYKERDFDALANLYSKDCVLMPPGFDEIKGRQATKALLSSLSDNGVDVFVLTTEDITPEGCNAAVERGKLVVKKTNGSIVYSCKYVLVWKRVDGTPEISTSIWNADSSQMKFNNVIKTSRK